MLKNHLRFAFRSFLRSRMLSTINTAGLSVGLAIALLIGLWVKDEYAYDRFNLHHDRIGRVMQHSTINGSTGTGYAMPIPLGDELTTRYGHEFKHVVLSWWLRDHVLAAGDRLFTQKGRFMQKAAPDIMALKMLQGSAAGLHDPQNILLSSSVARAVFGNEDNAMGQTLRIDNKMEVRVAGVYADIPHHSAFDNTMFVASWDLLMANDKGLQDVKNTWDWDATELYVEIADGTTMEKVSQAIGASTMNHLTGAQRAYAPRVFVHPMDRWHLYSTFTNGVNTGGQIQFVRLFSGIAIAVLLLACINFMNLSTARSEKRAREVGIRKAIGSAKTELWGQFFCESLVSSFASLLVAIGLVSMTLPFFNEMAGKDLNMPWDQPWFWVAALAVCMLTGVVAGLYPALYLSSFRPVETLKGRFKAGPNAALPRKILVVLQCSVSVLLIIGAGIVYRQIQYARNRPVGYEREGLISLAMTSPDLAAHADVLRTRLKESGNVVDLTMSSSPATWVYESFSGFGWPGKDPNMQDDLAAITVTPEYGRTLGWNFVQGRDFSREYATDSAALVLNEATVKYMGLKDPVGTRITWGSDNFTVIGVVKDMVMNSPYDPPARAVYYLPSPSSMPAVQSMRFMLMRLRPGAPVQQSLASIRSVLHTIVPTAPFDCKFVDQEYERKFAVEEKIGRLTTIFSILAIFISCMGIFGMASFMVEQRVREIGIRKVLGASTVSLWHLLSKDFVVLVVISLLVAMPLSYIAMSRWLQSYEYRTTIPPFLFAAAALGAILLTLATVSFQTIRAALANPAESLKGD